MKSQGEGTSRTSKPRWYMPTPGKFVALLLLAVVTLYLSDQYDWFAFNKQKGWTVLTAVAIVTAGLVVLAVWIAAAFFFRRRAQFGLVTLSLIIAGVALPCAWLAREIKAARQLTEEMGRLQQAGGTASFDYRPVRVEDGFSEFPYSHANTHARLRAILGDAFFADVLYVVLTDRCQFEMLTEFKQLRRVSVRSGIMVSDEDLLLLTYFPEFESIWATHSDITDAGLRTLENISTLKNVEILSSNASWQYCEVFEQSFPGHALVVSRYDSGRADVDPSEGGNESPAFVRERRKELLDADRATLKARLKELSERDAQLRMWNDRSAIEKLEKRVDPPTGAAPDAITPETSGESNLEDLLEI